MKILNLIGCASIILAQLLIQRKVLSIGLFMTGSFIFAIYFILKKNNIQFMLNLFLFGVNCFNLGGELL